MQITAHWKFVVVIILQPYISVWEFRPNSFVIVLPRDGIFGECILFRQYLISIACYMRKDHQKLNSGPFWLAHSEITLNYWRLQAHIFLVRISIFANAAFKQKCLCLHLKGTAALPLLQLETEFHTIKSGNRKTQVLDMMTWWRELASIRLTL